MSSGFQRQGFRIQPAKVSRIPDSRLPYMGRIERRFCWLGTGDYLSPGKGGGAGEEGGGVKAKHGEI